MRHRRAGNCTHQRLWPVLLAASRLRIGDSDLDLYAGLDVDRRDLLDDLGRRVQVDDALVDAHLETIPRLRTLTARGLARGDAQHLVGHAHRALDAQLLLLGARDQIGAHLLQRRDVLRRQRDADAVHLRHVRLGLLQLRLANESLRIEETGLRLGLHVVSRSQNWSNPYHSDGSGGLHLPFW